MSTRPHPAETTAVARLASGIYATPRRYSHLTHRMEPLPPDEQAEWLAQNGYLPEPGGVPAAALPAWAEVLGDVADERCICYRPTPDCPVHAGPPCDGEPLLNHAQQQPTEGETP